MVEGMLGSEGGSERVRCRGEHGIDSIANRFEHDPARCSDNLLEDGVMPLRVPGPLPVDELP